MLQFKKIIDYTGDKKEVYSSVRNWYNSIKLNKKLISDSPPNLLHFRLGSHFGILSNVYKQVSVHVFDSQLSLEVNVEVFASDIARRLHTPSFERLCNSLEDNIFKNK